MRSCAIAAVVVGACTSSGSSPRPAGNIFVDPTASERDLVNAQVANLKWNESADLKLDLPPGWTAVYEMRSWMLHKARDPDQAVMSIEIVSPRMPRTAAGLAARAQSYMNPGVVVKVAREEPLPEGVLAELDVASPGLAGPRLMMTAVRKLDDRILECELVWAQDEVGRREAEQICKSARR